MGEYATYKGQQVKVGTCEDMLYLRADQARLVSVNRSHGDTDVIGCASAIRFRFPFPDEDHVEPGSFGDPFRAVTVHGVQAPEGVEHYGVQFRADAGYLVSLPCPEGAEGRTPGLSTTVNGLNVHRNGFRGAVRIAQQRVWEGRLVLVLECGGCGTKWRAESLEDAQPIIAACLDEAKSSRGDWWREVATRIEAGYTSPLPWTV